MSAWGWSLVAVGVVLLVYELVAVAQHRLTISQLVWRESATRPWVPFGFGLLMGHLFL